jgi:hypothetical protein
LSELNRQDVPPEVTKKLTGLVDKEYSRVDFEKAVKNVLKPKEWDDYGDDIVQQAASLGLLNQLGVRIANEKALQKALTDLFESQKGKVSSAAALLKDVQKVLDAQKVVITDPAKQAVFQQRFELVLSGQEPGFVGAYLALADRVRGLAVQLREQEEYLDFLTKQESDRKEQIEVRRKYAQGLAAKLAAARAETGRLADLVQGYNLQLWRAQVELADVDINNQRMEQRIRQLERAWKGKKP